MKLKKEYIVLAVLIVALSAYLVVHKENRLHYRMPQLEKLNNKDITKITLKDSSSDITLLKEDGKWLILPEKFPADGALVKRMADKISTLTLTALAGEGRYGSVYGLDNSDVIKVTAYKGDKILRGFELGKSASEGRQTFVKLNKDSRVFYADGDLRDSFHKKVGDLRDKTVLSFSDDITGVTVENGGSKSVFLKAVPKTTGNTKKGKGTPSSSWQTAAGSKADGGKIEKLISTLSNLSCAGFVPSKTKQDFKNPSYVITLQGRKKTYSLSLLKKQGDNYPALSSQSDYPFYLQSWVAEPIIKDLAALSPSPKAVRPRKGKKV